MADYLPAPYPRPVMPARPVPGRVVPGSVTDTTGPDAYYSYQYGTSRIPRTGSVPPAPVPSSSGGTGNRFTRTAGFINDHSGQFRAMTDVPSGVPRFLGSRSLLFMLWIVAMILVASNEWDTFPWKFPRPGRFWYASITYGILFAASQADALVPICNALGIGYVVALGYENVNARGNSIELFGISFSGASSGGTSSSTPVNNKVVQTVSGTGPQAGVSA